ncbi:MAG TPA: GNAT family N-acetyltransferase [Acidimicrobiales bacterium]
MTGSVRPATINDADRILILTIDFAASRRPEFEPTSAEFRRSMAAVIENGNSCLLVAQVDDEISGYLLGHLHGSFLANGPVGWVEEVMVDSSRRRMGLGKELMSSFEQWSVERGCRLVALGTRYATDFYLALGYEVSASHLRKLL